MSVWIELIVQGGIDGCYVRGFIRAAAMAISRDLE